MDPEPPTRGPLEETTVRAADGGPRAERGDGATAALEGVFATRWPALVRRSRAVVAILVHHGLGSLARELRLRRWPVLSWPRRRSDSSPGPSHAVRLRCAVEEMGATFVKAAQILSTRADLLPPEISSELARLQEAVAPAPWPAVREQLERELRRPLGEVFAEIAPQPIAAASLGQVHAASLPGGEAVAVKVLRPGVERQVELDLAVLRRLAGFAARNRQLARWEPERLAAELTRTLREELDYRRERRNLERYTRQLATVAGARVPRVYPDYCSGRVLTMEHVAGVRIDDLAGLDALGVDRPALARLMARVLFDSALRHGFFHADPHPGNFRVLADGTLVILDFGMMGFLAPAERDALLELLLAMVAADAARCVDRLADLGLRAGAADESLLRRELARMLFDYADLPFGEMPMGEVLSRLLALLRALRLTLPTELALLGKTVLMAEGLGRRLDPGFRLVPVARPLVRQALVARLRPRGADDLAQAALDAASVARELPRRARRFGDRLAGGTLQVEVSVDQRAFVHELERLVRNLRVSALAAASILAMGLLTLAHPPASLPRWAPWLFGGGLAATLALLTYLVVDSWRARRL
jgi:ubiquinone biosynthesis protein